MAAVMTFWWHPEEEADFVAFLINEVGPPLAMPFEGRNAASDLIPVPLPEFLASNPQEMFLTSTMFTDQIVVTSFSKSEGSVYRVSDMNSCVVGYERGVFREMNKLTTSNLYFYTKYPNEAGTAFVEKPKDFVRWAKMIFQRVARATPESHNGIRMSGRVRKAVEEGQLAVTS